MFREKPYVVLIDTVVDEQPLYVFPRKVRAPEPKPLMLVGAPCKELIPEVCGVQDQKHSGGFTSFDMYIDELLRKMFGSLGLSERVFLQESTRELVSRYVQASEPPISLEKQPVEADLEKPEVFAKPEDTSTINTSRSDVRSIKVEMPTSDGATYNLGAVTLNENNAIVNHTAVWDPFSNCWTFIR